MKLSQYATGKIFMIFVLLSSLLAGCATATPAPAPTLDSSTVIAAAVSTLRAQQTEEALRNPNPTPIPSATPIPTNTPVPFTPTPSLPSLTPTSTATTAPAFSAKFLTAGTFPINKFEYVPNEKFSLAVRFLNNGSLAWPPGMKLKLTGFKGEVTCQPELELGNAVEPGKAVEFDLWAFGSETLGTHIWYFALYTPSGGVIPGGYASFSYTSK